jgi:hypothetical protein
MENLLDLYHKHPHFILYWAFCKSNFSSLEEWAKAVTETAIDRGALSSAIADALDLYKTHRIK